MAIFEILIPLAIFVVWCTMPFQIARYYLDKKKKEFNRMTWALERGRVVQDYSGRQYVSCGGGMYRGPSYETPDNRITGWDTISVEPVNGIYPVHFMRMDEFDAKTSWHLKARDVSILEKAARARAEARSGKYQAE